MSIKKIKFSSMYINDEKEITSKKDGKKYKLVEVGCKVADDCPDYAGKNIRITFFEYLDKKDPKKNKTATSRADYFKAQNLGKEIFLEVKEEEYIGKDLSKKVRITGTPLSKSKSEVAEQLLGKLNR